MIMDEQFLEVSDIVTLSKTGKIHESLQRLLEFLQPPTSKATRLAVKEGLMNFVVYYYQHVKADDVRQKVLTCFAIMLTGRDCINDRFVRVRSIGAFVDSLLVPEFCGCAASVLGLLASRSDYLRRVIHDFGLVKTVLKLCHCCSTQDFPATAIRDVMWMMSVLVDHQHSMQWSAHHTPSVQDLTSLVLYLVLGMLRKHELEASKRLLKRLMPALLDTLNEADKDDNTGYVVCGILDYVVRDNRQSKMNLIRREGILVQILKFLDSTRKAVLRRALKFIGRLAIYRSALLDKRMRKLIFRKMSYVLTYSHLRTAWVTVDAMIASAGEEARDEIPEELLTLLQLSRMDESREKRLRSWMVLMTITKCVRPSGWNLPDLKEFVIALGRLLSEVEDPLETLDVVVCLLECIELAEKSASSEVFQEIKTADWLWDLIILGNGSNPDLTCTVQRIICKLIKR